MFLFLENLWRECKILKIWPTKNIIIKILQFFSSAENVKKL
jgi:hypothetical protein